MHFQGKMKGFSHEATAESTALTQEGEEAGTENPIHAAEDDIAIIVNPNVEEPEEEAAE